VAIPVATGDAGVNKSTHVSRSGSRAGALRDRYGRKRHADADEDRLKAAATIAIDEAKMMFATELVMPSAATAHFATALLILLHRFEAL
jgi:hypothetical protein